MPFPAKIVIAHFQRFGDRQFRVRGNQVSPGRMIQLHKDCYLFHGAIETFVAAGDLMLVLGVEELIYTNYPPFLKRRVVILPVLYNGIIGYIRLAIENKTRGRVKWISQTIIKVDQMNGPNQSYLSPG